MFGDTEVLVDVFGWNLTVVNEVGDAIFDFKVERYLTGIAKFRFCPAEKLANAMPTTCPDEFKTGPPLLPGK